jgi:hypothetical protein
MDPFHWPKEFEVPAHINLVLIALDGSIVSKKISHRHFDNPLKFVDSVEEFLMASPIEGL